MSDVLTIQVMDSLGLTAQALFTIPFTTAPTISTSSPLSNATQSNAYSTTIAATGGIAPYTWSITSHTGTNTWSINAASGVLTGTPASVETDTITVQVLDSLSQPASKTFSLQVVAGSAGVSPLGINLGVVTYFSPEQPFINILKSAGRAEGTGDGMTGWITRNPGNFDTGEAGYLQLDSDGNVTSLTASPIPSGGQLFTTAYCNINNSIAVGTGASLPYPSGTYRLQATGNGVIAVSGDGTGTLTITDGGTHSITFNVTPSAAGMKLTISSVGGGTGAQLYPINISLLQNSLATSYDAGAIFHPNFLASVANANGFRFMDWQQIATLKFQNSGVTPATGSTSMTLSSAWLYPSGTYKGYHSDGSTKNCTLTIGATTCTWTGALGTVGSGHTYFEIPTQTFANRSKPSNMFWSLVYGVPYEVCIALCNQINAHFWNSMPLTADDTYVSSLSALVLSGTGAQAGFTFLNSSLKFFSELSNEVWNGAATPFTVAGYLGKGVWPAQPSGSNNFIYAGNWYGMRCATKSLLEQTAWGGSFTARCFPCLGGQAAATGVAQTALNATYWTTGTGAPSTYPIRILHIGGYWGDYLSAGDTTIMTSQADGGLSYFFQLQSSNTVTGGTNAGHVFGPTADQGALPSSGFLGIMEGWVNNHKTLVAGSYPNQKLAIYEGGQNFLFGGAAPAGWNTLAKAAQLDARMGTTYTAYFNFWATTIGATDANMNFLYSDCNPLGSETWGMIESTMQTLATVPKWAAWQAWVT